MSAEHNHPPRCCCEEIDNGTDGFEPGELLTCPGCPEHGDLATPYTEQETTNG